MNDNINMNKLATIAFVSFAGCLSLFVVLAAIIQSSIDAPAPITETLDSVPIPVIPMEPAINIESDGELSVTQVVVVPEVTIYGTRPITGAGAARRRATAVETERESAQGASFSLSLLGDTGFSTEAARSYRPKFSRRTREVSLEFDRSKVGVPAYQPEREDKSIEIEIDMRR
jgi:hypothetical protein